MTKEQEKKRKKFMQERQALNKEQRNKLAKEEIAKKKTYTISGVGNVSKAEYDKERKLTGTSNDPALARRQAQQPTLQSKAKENPEQLGFIQTEPQIIPTQVSQPTQPDQTVPNLLSLQGVSNLVGGKPVNIAGKEISTGVGGMVESGQVQAGYAPPIVPTGALWKVGAETIANPTKAIQAGNAAKNAGLVKNAIAKIKEFPLIAGAGGAILASTIRGFFDKTNEMQQGLNTIGQTTSTIVGQSTSAAGDWRKGLQELDKMEQAVLELEQKIKAGQIASPTIKVDGRVIDVNADIEDQLKTIYEGKTDIRSFVLQGQFPEMTDFEIQQELRALEEGGYIEAIDYGETNRDY